MKIGVISDLHLEFSEWKFTPDPDVFYIVAGDIHPYPEVRQQFLDLFDPSKVFYVMGNHDYYGSTFPEPEDDQFSIEVDGLKIAGATLWTDMNPVEFLSARQGMMDYRQISGITHQTYKDKFESDLAFLKASNADIIVTHHLPSYLSVSEKYKGSPLNPAFASDLDLEILEMKPKLWVHGHTHGRFDYYIGGTRILCNPRGYPNENPWWRTYEPQIVEIS